MRHILAIIIIILPYMAMSQQHLAHFSAESVEQTESISLQDSAIEGLANIAPVKSNSAAKNKHPFFIQRKNKFKQFLNGPKVNYFDENAYIYYSQTMYS